MSLEENKAILRRYIEKVWHSPEVLDDLMADEVAWPHKTESREDFKKGWEQGRAGFPDASPTIWWTIAEGDRVAACSVWEGTHTGEWLGIPPTNKQVKWWLWICVRIADGKIVELDQIWTQLNFLERIGFSPSWGELIEQAKNKLA